jgi:hypothetical protein
VIVEIGMEGSNADRATYTWAQLHCCEDPNGREELPKYKTRFTCIANELLRFLLQFRARMKIAGISRKLLWIEAEDGEAQSGFDEECSWQCR